MASDPKRKKQSEGDASVPAKQESPRCLAIAGEGIETASDFANMMSALMSDLVDGRVSPQVGNATCNAGGKLLRVVELQYKYGTSADGSPEKSLQLAGSRRLAGASAD